MAPRFIGLGVAPSPATGFNDLYLDETGNLALVTDAEAVGQHVRQRLTFWKREWFLNQDAGIDFLRYILGRLPSEQPIAEAVLKREILATPGVVEITEFDATFDRASRGLKVLRAVILTEFDDEIELNL